MNRIVWLYPKHWRVRYGDEISELLAHSSRPRVDQINVALHALFAWMEVPMIRSSLTAIAGAALVIFGFSVGQLSGGVSEIPQHWWSSASALGALCAVAAVTASNRVRRRTSPTD